jgi:meso-butanediol dehydrogenase/(S,S)-butanediol dehydrogenase/diacetyl reductase
MRFTGTTAVVVGGARGIGRASALRLGSEGAPVIVADAVEDAARQTSEEIIAAGGSSDFAELNATDPGAVGRFFYGMSDRGATLDILVNCPAHASDTHFERVTESEFDFDIGVTLKAPFLCIQAAIPLLLRSPVASVVSIGSVNGIGAYGNEAYGAAKAGLINLTRNLSIRYGPHGIRFNVVAPGTVNTHSWDSRLAVEPDILERVSRFYPLGRVGLPDDIAGAVAFLASADASWITGVTLPVDGGLTAGHGELIGTILGEGFFDTTTRERPLR